MLSCFQILLVLPFARPHKLRAALSPRALPVCWGLSSWSHRAPAISVPLLPSVQPVGAASSLCQGHLHWLHQSPLFAPESFPGTEWQDPLWWRHWHFWGHQWRDCIGGTVYPVLDPQPEEGVNTLERPQWRAVKADRGEKSTCMRIGWRSRICLSWRRNCKGGDLFTVWSYQMGGCGARLLSEEHRERTRGNGQIAVREILIRYKEKLSQRGWLSTGTGCPGTWVLHPWTDSKLNRTWHWATSSNWTCFEQRTSWGALQSEFWGNFIIWKILHRADSMDIFIELCIQQWERNPCAQLYQAAVPLTAPLTGPGCSFPLISSVCFCPPHPAPHQAAKDYLEEGFERVLL